MMDESKVAFTLAEAADFLGVTSARVSQLLGEGRLEGPETSGQRRAPKNAPRVWKSSAASYADDPANRRPGRRRATRQVQPDQHEVVDDLRRENTRLREREMATRHSALEFKSLADHLGEALEEERRRRLAAEVEAGRLKAELSGLQETAQERQARLETYSDALTNLLTEDTLRDEAEVNRPAK